MVSRPQPTDRPVRILRVERRSQTAHLAGCLLHRYAGFQPANRRPDGIPTVAPHAVFIAEGGWNVDLRRDCGSHRVGEVARHHADDVPDLVLERNRLADDLRVASKLPLPEPVAQDGDPVAAVRFLGGRERPAEHRDHAKDAEEVRRHAERAHGLAMALGVPQAERSAGHGGQAVEQLLLRPPIEKRLGRSRIAQYVTRFGIGLEHGHEPVVLVEGQTAQDDGIDDGKDGGGRPDAEREDRQRDSGVGGRLAQYAHGVDNVPPQRRERVAAAWCGRWRHHRPRARRFVLPVLPHKRRPVLHGFTPASGAGRPVPPGARR